eukprot:g14998.t1
MERMRSELAEKDQAHGNAEEACKAEAIARAQAEEHKKLAERDVELLTNQLEQTIAELSAAKTSAETQTQRIKELETRVKELQEPGEAGPEMPEELETSVQTEQEQRVVAETDLRALKQKVELESAKMEQILAAKEMLESWTELFFPGPMERFAAFADRQGRIRWPRCAASSSPRARN